MMYGYTPFGHKFHIASEFQTWGMRTLCGNTILDIFDSIEVPWEFTDDFCKTCFRNQAWELFKQRAETGNLVDRQLDRIARALQ